MLKAGQNIQGTWSAKINVAIGDHQDQGLGWASYPIQPSKTEFPTAVYRTEPKSKEPEEPCFGTVNEPVAQAGFVCFYRGGNTGSEEKEDENAAFFGFSDVQGAVQGEEGKEGSKLGEFILFRTTSPAFAEGCKKPLVAACKVTAAAYLNTQGSWAMTALKIGDGAVQ